MLTMLVLTTFYFRHSLARCPTAACWSYLMRNELLNFQLDKFLFIKKQLIKDDVVLYHYYYPSQQ